MARRENSVERDDDALFVKDGVPVKFCFHRSVTQGRGQITRDVERKGGQMIANERHANVLLVDEQEDIMFLRRQYYSSTERYRLSLYVEPRGFVQHCIRVGEYRHVAPSRRGMPGRAQSGGRREKGVRIDFTEEDRDHLAFYLATRCPTRDGRMGNSAYKDLERLGQTDDLNWTWARRHTFHSWREHYKKNPALMNAKIDAYLEQLKDVGHHLGHDLRSHEYGNLRMEEEEETEDEVEEVQGQGMERRRRERRRLARRREQVRPAAAARRSRNDRARREQLVASDDETEEEGSQQGEAEAEAVQDSQRIKRQRAPAHQRHDARGAQAKRARVSEVLSDEERASGVDADHGQTSGDEESEEIEGDDLFGDRAYVESRFKFDDQQIEFPQPYSPRAQSPVEWEGAPPSTQATLIASPRAAERAKEPGPTPMKAVGPRTLFPAGTQETVVATRERVAVRRERVHGASAQPGPSVPRERRTRCGVATVVVEVPYRARSRSVEPQPRPESRTESQRRRQQDQARRGKGKAKEGALVLIEEDTQVKGPVEWNAEEEVEAVVVTTSGLSTMETMEDEIAVEGLLEESVVTELSEGNGASEGEGEGVVSEGEGSGASLGLGDEDAGDVMPELPRYQEIGSEPSDSDDVETHGSLVRGSIREGSVRVDVGENGSDVASQEEEGQNQRQDQNQDRALNVREGIVDVDDSKSTPIQEQEQGDIEIEIEDSGSDTDDTDADADRIERMARGSLHVPTPIPPEPRVTRSMAAQPQTEARMQTRAQMQTRAKSQFSPRRTRSTARARAITPGFPSPGTKARAVVDRFQAEERQMPYEPPAGSQAAKVVRPGGRRGRG